MSFKLFQKYNFLFLSKVIYNPKNSPLGCWKCNSLYNTTRKMVCDVKKDKKNVNICVNDQFKLEAIYTY